MYIQVFCVYCTHKNSHIILSLRCHASHYLPFHLVYIFSTKSIIVRGHQIIPPPPCSSFDIQTQVWEYTVVKAHAWCWTKLHHLVALRHSGSRPSPYPSLLLWCSASPGGERGAPFPRISPSLQGERCHLGFCMCVT